MPRILAFLIGTVPILLLSRRSLRHPGTHGFYRFFVFEVILVLVVLNLEYWFRAPFSVEQLVSWFLLTLSAGLVVAAVRVFHRLGRPDNGAGFETDLPFERTSHLVTTGVYRHIRHPMYASLLCLAWGVALKDVGVVSVALGVSTTGLLVVTARVEERENIARFGDQYTAYMRSTRLFLPGVF